MVVTISRYPVSSYRQVSNSLTVIYEIFPLKFSYTIQNVLSFSARTVSQPGLSGYFPAHTYSGSFGAQFLIRASSSASSPTMGLVNTDAMEIS